MRSGEKQGREHLFVSLQQFEAMIAKGELLEHQEVTPGKFYGIPRQIVADCLKNAEVRIADIEVLGAEKLARAYPEMSFRSLSRCRGRPLMSKVKFGRAHAGSRR